MEYNELKSKIEDCRRSISKIKHKRKGIEKELTEIREGKHTLESNYQKEYDKVEKESYEKYLAEQLEPIESGIRELESKLESCKSEYTKKMSELTEENISDLYTGEQEISEEIKASTNVLQDRLQKVVSKRFQSELENQMDSYVISLEGSNLEGIIDYFNKQSVMIDKMSKSQIKFDVLGYFSNQFITTNPLDSVNDPAGSLGKISNDKLNIFILVVLACVILFFAAKYVFPVYLLALVLYGVYNVLKHYRIYSALVAQKVVKDNVRAIDDSLRMKVQDELKRQQDALTAKNQREVSELNSKLASKRQELSTATVNASNTFVFNEDSLNKSYEAAINAKENREISLVSEDRELSVQLNDLFKELKINEDLLKDVAGSIQEEYLNYEKIGSSVIFEPKFIIDVKDAKPVFFKHPQQSCLFLYEEPVDVSDLIRLLSVQLRIKLNPFNLSITVVDQNYMGTDYLIMQPSVSNDTSIKNLFRIITSKEELDERVGEYNDDMLKRIKNIKRNFSNIAEYNQYMVEHESLAESYDFLFFQDPTTADFQNKTVQQLLLNGADVGIFTHMFMRVDEFFELANAASKIVEQVGACFVIRDGEIYKRAKDFVLENMVKQTK